MIKDISGQPFGRLTAIRPDGAESPTQPMIAWVCRCECGREVRVRGTHLRAGAVRSCGCWRNELNRASGRRLNREHPRAAETHGATRMKKWTPTYVSWRAMRQRVLRPSNHNYRYYGGRGIVIDPRWDDFSTFLADMGPRPNGMTLDRINPSGDYTPENCRWATAKQQRVNRRDS